MVYLIDPAKLKGPKCPKLVCDIVCKLCTTLCAPENVPLYGIPEEEL